MKPNEITFYLFENKDDFLKVDWGIADSIDGFDWVSSRDEATEFTKIEKEDLMNRGADFGPGEWNEYKKIITKTYIKKDKENERV